MNKKILMIINEFPPTGESGVQRPLKFVKYLVRFGYSVYVVTPARPTKTVLDYSLLDEVPEEAKIFKTASLGLTGKGTKSIQNLRYNVGTKPNGYKKSLWKFMKNLNDFLFPIDKQIGWVPFAYWKSVKLIKRYKIRNVYITGFPFSAFLAGIILKKRFGNKIFWLADYRDAWQFEPKFKEQVNHFRQKVIYLVESLVIKRADYFTFATDYITRKYCSHFPFITQRSLTITNGYDEDDFENLQPRKFEKFTFLYMGKFYSFKGSPIPLLNALQKYKQLHHEFDFEFIHIGTIPRELLDYIEIKKMDFYTYLGYKSHKEALSYAAGADVSVIIVNNDPESKGVLTGKVFELGRLGNPILALGPRESLLEKFILDNGLGEFAFCEDENEISEAIGKIVKRKPNKNQIATIKEFSRENLARKLTECYPQ
jgi:glycosyltransferase involved in cell wall biosynthesis